VADQRLDAFTSRAQMQPFTEDDQPSVFSDTVAAAFALTRREELATSASLAWSTKVDERAKIIGKLGGDEQLARGYSLVPASVTRMWREAELEGRLDSDPTWRAGSPEARSAYQLTREYEKRHPDQVQDDQALLDQSRAELSKLRPIDQHTIERGGGAAAFIGAAGATFTDPLILLTAPLGLGELAAGRGILATMGRTALSEGAVALATEIPIQAQVAAFKREIQSPWTFKDSAMNVLAAGVGGAVLGGAIAGGVAGTRKLLADYRARKAAGQVQATPDMDAAEQVLEDSLAMQEQNPLATDFPDAAEQVHEQALSLAREQVEAGRPVDVVGEVSLLERPDPVGRVFTRAEDPAQLVDVDPLAVSVDAKTFQFKGGGDDVGVTGALKGVDQFDRRLAGVALIWERADGQQFIADGHQRLALARRAIAAGQDPAEVRLNGFVLRESDGVSAQDARRMAAIKNMAEGSGSPLDAAKILRDVGPTGEALLPPLPPRSALVRQARGLAQLSDETFLQVVNGVVDERFGALIGSATADPKLQAAMLQVIKRAQPANELQARSIVDQVKAQGVETRTTEDLFGEQTFSESMYIERAQVLDAALRAARTDRAVFGGLVSNQTRISGVGGNRLDRAGNLARQQEASDVAAQISIRANAKGELSDALNDAARRVRDGATPAAAAGDFLAAARRSILQGDTGRGAPGAAGRAGEAPGAGVVEPKVGQPVSLQAVPEPARRAATVAFKDKQTGQTIDQLYQVAEAHQARLAAAAEEISALLGDDVEVVNPGVKNRKGSEEKIARKGYQDAGDLTDVIRLGFITRMPAHAQQVINMLAQRFELLDEGVSVTELGYIDQKALVRFPDGRVAEVQLWDRALLDAKNGAGHGLYEQVRGMTPEQLASPEGQALNLQVEEASRQLYAQAIAQASPEWRRVAMQALPEHMRARVQSLMDEGAGAAGVGSGSGGTSGKVSKNAPSDSRRPDSSTSTGTTLDQTPAPGDTKKASVPAGASRTTAGLPSQLKNRSAIDAPPRSIVSKVDNPHSAQPQASRTGTVEDGDYESVMSQYQALTEDLGAQLKVAHEVDGVLVERQAGAVIEELDSLEESLERIRICATPARSVT
jgi:hypothetical protein